MTRNHIFILAFCAFQRVMAKAKSSFKPLVVYCFQTGLLVNGKGQNVVITKDYGHPNGSMGLAPNQEPIPFRIEIGMEEVAQKEDSIGPGFVEQLIQHSVIAFYPLLGQGNAGFPKMRNFPKVEVRKQQGRMRFPPQGFMR